MSTTGGVFSESALVNIQAKADAIWQDRIQQMDYVANAEVVKFLQAQQTATFGDMLTGKKDRTVEISWINACDVEDAECADCTITGNELSTNKDEKYLSRCREAGFYVKENDFRNNLYDMEEVIAKGLLAASKVLDEWWAAQAMVTINASKGVNESDGGKGTVSGTDTYILPGFWDANLLGYFSRMAVMNRFKSPMLLSGANLYESFWAAQMEAAQAGDEAKIKKFSALPLYFDLFNIDSANDPDLVTYLINRGTFAFVTKAYYNGAPVTYFDSKRYSMPSYNLPGVVYDVHYTNSCDQTNGLYNHYYKLVTYGDIFLNPIGCTATRTGDLSFICGAVPVVP